MATVRNGSQSQYTFYYSFQLKALELNPSYTTQFNIHKFHILPTRYINVFCVDLRTNSDYFTTQH
jgi:hypothetical protein